MLGVHRTRVGLATGLMRACAALLPGCGRSPSDAADTVVLVHGLARSPASMAVLGTRLRRAGFYVVNFGYPSTSEEIEALVDRLAVLVTARAAKTRRGLSTS